MNAPASAPTVTPFRFDHADGIVVVRAGSRGASAPLALLVGALLKTAHAYAYGQGRPVDDDAWWAVLAPGAVAAMARPEKYFLADNGCSAERAALLAHRVQFAMRSTHSAVSEEELDKPFAFVATPGVPVAEARTLAALSVLALLAAGELAGPIAARGINFVGTTLPTDDADGCAWAGLLATRLDRPDSLEIETRRVLCAVASTLIDGHPDLGDWIPRHRDPTVRLRTPASAPGIPLVFVPFTVRTKEARHAIAHGGLLDRAVAQCAQHLAFAPVPAHTH